MNEEIEYEEQQYRKHYKLGFDTALDEAIDKMQKLKQEKATGLMQANIVGVPILAELDEVIEALTTLKQTQ